MRKHLQRSGNLFVIGLLRSPLHRLASGSLLLITYRGRRSGRRFTFPVMYAEREGTLTIFVGHPERKQVGRPTTQRGSALAGRRGVCSGSSPVQDGRTRDMIYGVDLYWLPLGAGGARVGLPRSKEAGMAVKLHRRNRAKFGPCWTRTP
jgi:hypothetical protein